MNTEERLKQLEDRIIQTDKVLWALVAALSKELDAKDAALREIIATSNGDTYEIRQMARRALFASPFVGDYAWERKTVVDRARELFNTGGK